MKESNESVQDERAIWHQDELYAGYVTSDGKYGVTRYNPTLTLSADNGETWGTAVQVINAGDGGQRPYPKYCSNHEDRIDMIYTDAHPADQPTAIYHLYYQTNAFMKSDGALIKAMAHLRKT